jgi:hypothetical protein
MEVLLITQLNSAGGIVVSYYLYAVPGGWSMGVPVPVGDHRVVFAPPLFASAELHQRELPEESSWRRVRRSSLERAVVSWQWWLDYNN